jgi:uncharacterized membrane protein
MSPTLDQPTGAGRGWFAILKRRLRALKWRAERWGRQQLVWNNVFRATSYLRSALWTVPFVAMILVLAIVPVLRWIDGWLGWRVAGLSVSGAKSLFESVISLTLSFLVFTFGSLLVALQVASGQLTPRIIATALLRDPVVKYSVGLFVFTLIFSVMALDRLGDRVAEIVALTAAFLGIACMAAFLFLIDHAARLLRPVSILARIGEEGLAVIDTVYPIAADAAADDISRMPVLPETRRVVIHRGPSAIVLAVDLATLVREAQRTRGVVEFVPQVGDFIAIGEPLFVLYGEAIGSVDARLQTTVAVGSERTMEQDPMFAFRIMADIGLKALSPAINDPTTAVLALDQIHRLLRAVGRRRLQSETILDSAGKVRVIYRTPDWEDFVQVACREIRIYGGANVQVSRRLRAMFENLTASLPSYRHAALEHEAELLARALPSLYRQPEDLALAQIPDVQGLGGSSARRPTISGHR